MADKKQRKAPVRKDPKIYAGVVEYGWPEKNIPKRPLFARTLADYEEIFQEKVNKAQAAILAAWS